MPIETNERVKEMLIKKALEKGILADEIERMYGVTFVSITKTNKNKFSYSETEYYGNSCKVTFTEIYQK